MNTTVLKATIKRTILLVSSPEQAGLIQAAFESQPALYQFSVVHNLLEARKFLNNSRPDLVMVSLSLTDGRGLELFSHSGKPLLCPLIILADEPSRHEALEAIQKGAKDYILIDVTPAYEIPRIIERSIRQHFFNLEYLNTQNLLINTEEKSKASLALIRLVMKETSGKKGKDFLKSLVKHLAMTLKVPYAGIGKLNAPHNKDVTVQAFWKENDFGESFTYDLANTPCQTVLGQSWCIYPENARKAFPKDKMLVDMGIESYMGVALYDDSGKAIGILWVMDKTPLKNTYNMKEIMSIFAIRTQFELQLTLMKDSKRNLTTMAQSLMDSAVDGIITINEKGIIESFNQAAEKIFGYPSQEVADQNIQMLMPESFKSEHIQSLQQYTSNGAKRIIGIEREAQGLRKDGSNFHLELAVSEVQLDGRRCFNVIVRDISHRKKMEQELVRAKIQADNASYAKTEFLSRISHEFRTPLNSILGFSQLLEMAAIESQAPDKQITFIDQIIKAGNHLLELLNGALDLSKVESGKIDVHLEPIQLPVLFEELLAKIHPIAQQKEINISNPMITEGSTTIRGDKAMLKQCLLNLLSNAVKHSHSGGDITLGCRPDTSDTLRIFVTDTGPGLSKDQQDSVFEPFERLDAEPAEVEDSGIGLTLTKRMIELMKGTIGYDSEEGKGTTFYIELPVFKEERPDILKPKTRPPSPEPKHRGYHIFYIEDNPANLRLIQQALSRMPKIHLSSASTGGQGLLAIQEEKPDLILLDMGLPDMEGAEVIKQLKEEPLTQDIPIVVLSANALKSQIDQSIAMGINHYLTKPIDLKKLFSLIYEFSK